MYGPNNISEEDIDVLLSAFWMLDESSLINTKNLSRLALQGIDRRKNIDNKNLQEYIYQGKLLQSERYADSGYGDLTNITAPFPLEAPLGEIPTIGWIHAVNEKNKVLGTMMIFNAHQLLPHEDDFAEEIASVRLEHSGKEMVYFGRFATHEYFITTKFMALLLLKRAIIFFMESEAHVGLIIVNPDHESFYELLGFRRRAYIPIIKSIGQPGVLMSVVKKETVNAKNINRLLWGIR